MYEYNNEWEQLELEEELQNMVPKLKSLWNRGKGKAKDLVRVAQIIAKLAAPPVDDDNPATPPVELTTAGDNQTIDNRKRRDQAQTVQGKTPAAGGDKEMEYEIAILTAELGSIYNKIKETLGTESILSEVLLESLEAESYDVVKGKTWQSIMTDLKNNQKQITGIKNLSRSIARKLHFAKPETYQPIGVEVHHWVPFKYAHLFTEYTLDQLNRMTVPIDSFTHALIGAAIDRAAKGGKAAIENVLNKLAVTNWRNGLIQLNPAYFNNVSDVQFLPAPKLSKGKTIGVIRNATDFKKSFGLPRELEFEAANVL